MIKGLTLNNNNNNNNNDSDNNTELSLGVIINVTTNYTDMTLSLASNLVYPITYFVKIGKKSSIHPAAWRLLG